MDFTKIDANKNVILYKNMTANISTFTLPINTVSFTPDYMIVRSIHYEPDNNDSIGPYLLYCDLIGDDIGIFGVTTSDGANNIPSPIPTPQLYFKLQRPIQGSVTFTVRTNNPPTTFSLQGYMAIALEFVKLKAEHPQKVY